MGYSNLVVGNEEEFIALAKSLQLDADDGNSPASAAKAIAAFHYIQPPHSKEKPLPPSFTYGESTPNQIVKTKRFLDEIKDPSHPQSKSPVPKHVIE